jgi:hypothetical protein
MSIDIMGEKAAAEPARASMVKVRMLLFQNAHSFSLY